MESLSIELKELIVSFVNNSEELASLCCVNKLFNSITSRRLYKKLIIKSPRAYLKLKDTLIKTNHSLCDYVYRLDFSGYSTKGSRMSQERAKSLINPEELSNLIRSCKNIKEFQIGEEMMNITGVSVTVFQTIFYYLTSLETIDFTAFCNRDNSLEKHFNIAIPKKLTNISLYMSSAFDRQKFLVPFFQKVNENQSSLKRLDLGNTLADSNLFLHLQNITTLTHLSLRGCFAINCCSPLISYLQNNTPNLVLLDLEMPSRGNASRFCHQCLYDIIVAMNKTEYLNLGGHPNVDDSLMHRLMASVRPFIHLKYLSLAATGITKSILATLLTHLFPNLYYINLSKSILFDLEVFLIVENSAIQVIEVGTNYTSKYPAQINDWVFTTQGRRAYYSRVGVDPRFCFPKKIILLDQQEMSSMNKYWCYSY